jgi:uncharacterized protein
MSEEFVPRDGLLLVSIRESVKTRSIYDATRYAWPVSRRRIEEKVDLVLGCAEGIVQGVFVPSHWLNAAPGEASEKNFPGFKWTHKGQRWGFEGKEAHESIQKRYLGKRVPEGLKIGQIGFRYFEPAA